MRKIIFAFFLFSGMFSSVYAAGDKAVLSAGAEYSYFPARSIAAGQGRASLAETETGLSCRFKIKDQLPVKISLRTVHIDLSQGSGYDLPSHLEEQQLDLETTFFFPGLKSKDLYLRLGLTPSFFSDDWAFPSSAFRLPLRAAAIYQQDEKFTFIAGARLAVDTEQELLPFLGIIYKPNRAWTIALIPPRPRVSYQLRKDIKLFAEAEYDAGEYEVEHQGQKGLVLRKKGFNCGLGLAYAWADQQKLEISAGRALNHYFKYEDNRAKISLNDGWYLRCSFNSEF